MAEVEPLDCPFCGGQAEATGYDWAYYARCMDRECIASCHGLHYETREEAIAAWNRRASLSAAEKMAEALRTIAEWRGKFPPTDRFWDEEKTRPMSYAAAYGSNGERDYMRMVASTALADFESSRERKPG